MHNLHFLNNVMWPLELWEQILYANMSHPLSQTKCIYISLYILSMYFQNKLRFLEEFMQYGIDGFS